MYTTTDVYNMLSDVPERSFFVITHGFFSPLVGHLIPSQW